MDQLEKAKVLADEALKAGRSEEAVRKYESLLNTIDAFEKEYGDAARSDAHLADARFGTPGDLVSSLRRAVLNNASMACLKLEDNLGCIRYCDEAIRVDANANPKALYRRAQANRALGKAALNENFLRLATADVDAILALESANAQAKALKQDIKRTSDEVQTAKKYEYALDTIKEVTSERMPMPAPPSGGGYSFMNPDWKASDLQEQKQQHEDEMLCVWASASSPALHAAALGKHSATAAPSSPSVSIKELLRDARKATATVGVGDKSKGLTESDSVRRVIDELRQTELQAAATVKQRVATSSSAGGTATRTSGAVKAPKYKTTSLSSTDAAVATAAVLSAWDQLQLEEQEAAKRFKELVLDK